MSPVAWGDIFTSPLRGDRIMELRQTRTSPLRFSSLRVYSLPRTRAHQPIRRHAMRLSVVSIVFFVLTNSLFAQQSQVPEIRYHSVPDFLKFPADLHLGEAVGVAVNSKGHIFVFSRGSTTGPAYGAAAAQLLEFAPDGKFLREIGQYLYAWAFAHSVRIDKEDNT